MTTHTFRITLSPRGRGVYARLTPAPRLAAAARLLSQLTGIDEARCTMLVNSGTQFKCEFRSIVQYSETMLDYGYRIFVVPRKEAEQ